MNLVSLNGCLGSTERGGWRGVGRKGWQRVGEGLAKGWRRVGKGLAHQESPRQTKPKKGQNEKFMNFAHFCELWCFSLGKQAQFSLNFCSGMPLRKVHELAFLWFGLPGPLLSTWLAKGWQRVGGLPCTLQFCNSRGARLEDWVCDSQQVLNPTPLNLGVL